MVYATTFAHVDGKLFRKTGHDGNVIESRDDAVDRLKLRVTLCYRNYGRTDVL